MKAFLAFLLLLALKPLGFAQPYSINWFTVAGGGGTSSGGQFSVSGTVGQSDAGVMSGGNFTLTGGFWGVIAAVQSPGAPVLTITPAGANVIISWPSPSTGFALQQSPTISPTSWTTGPAPSDNGTIKSVTVPGGPGDMVYRLTK
jgi:hypothetical protein